MKPLFRRKRRAREDEAGYGATPLGASPPTEPLAHDQPTEPRPGASTALAVPADDLDAIVGQPPTSRRRGRLRRRLRHLRRVREVLLRDLGGVVFEIHKVGAQADAVMQAKLHRLALVDAELRELEGLLDDRRGMVIREPGIGGSCPECGELFGSEARYCWACGSTVVPGEGGVPHLAAYLGSQGPQPAGSLERSWVEHSEPGSAEDPASREAGGPADAAAPTEVIEDAETVETPAPGSEPAAPADAHTPPPGPEPAATGEPGSPEPGEARPAGGESGATGPEEAPPADRDPGTGEEPGGPAGDPSRWIPPADDPSEPPPLTSGDPLGVNDRRES